MAGCTTDVRPLELFKVETYIMFIHRKCWEKGTELPYACIILLQVILLIFNNNGLRLNLAFFNRFP